MTPLACCHFIYHIENLDHLCIQVPLPLIFRPGAFEIFIHLIRSHVVDTVYKHPFLPQNVNGALTKIYDDWDQSGDMLGQP